MNAQEYIDAWDNRWENHFRLSDLAQELTHLHGIDVVAQLESVLIAEMNKEVNKHIKNDIARLFNISIQQAQRISNLVDGEI